jgi:hypothetical protein
LLRDFLESWLFAAYEEGAFRLRPEQLTGYLAGLRKRGAITEHAWSDATTHRVAAGVLKIAPAARSCCRSLMVEDPDLGNTLEIESSDLLLVALLPKLARIFARDPITNEPGIARIRDIAEAYLETQARVDPDP